MAAPVTAIKRYRGDTKDVVLFLTKDKVIFPLAGASAILSVSTEKSPTGNTYLFQSTAVVDEAEGSLSFPITTENADNLGDFFYDVQLTDVSNKISTILKGKWGFEQDITK